MGATGVGVTQADLTVAGGTGYVGAPEVIFSSAGVVAGGTPAAGYALISGGSVVGIVITSPGTYTAGTTPTVTLTGGGGTGASVTVGSLATANVSGGLTKIGAGTLTLSGANTYTGGTTVTGGTLAIGVNGALDSTGNVTVNGGTLSMTTFNNTVGTVSLQSGSITGSTGVLTATSDYDLQSGTASAILGGAVGATKTTAGTVTLSGANTFSGVVNVNAGTLAFSASNNLGDASATNTLGVNGGTLSYTGTGAVNLGATRTLKLGASGGTLNASSGTGALTIAGGIDSTSTGNLTKTGPGTIILGGTNSWNSGANSVTVSDGTLRAGFGTGGIGALNVGATGVMDFRNSLAEALTLGGTSGALTLAGGARLGFELGASGSNDQVNVGLGGTALTGGTITLDFFNLAGFGAGTYNLLTAPSGLSAASYVLGTAPGGFNYTINVTDSLVSLGVVSYVPIYWTGSQSTSWATINPGPLTNWATDAAGTLDYGTTPTTTDTVIFSATNAVGGTITTTLDGSYTLDGVQFINAPTTPVTTAVVINQGTGGTLTLAPSSTSGGILVGANGGNVTINAPVVASTAQTWNVDGTGASSLTIAGNVAFNAAVTKNGAGVLTLSGNNSGTGALTLSAGTLNINSATAIGGGTFTIAAGATIDNTSGSAVTLTTSNNMNWNGSFTITGSNALSFGTGNATLGLNTTVTTTASTLTVNGAIADGGSNRNLTKAGAGTLSAGGNLSIGGNLDVTAGTATFGGSTNTIGGSVSMSGTALTMNGNSTIGNGVSVTAGTATMNGNNTITGSVLVNGGALTLGGANSISSGVTLSAGTLNVANAGALGTSAMTVNGGTLDNTSGSALALSPSVAEIWNGSFTFAGSNNLDVGSGAVTLNNSITVTTTANTLTVGGVIDDGINVFNLTKAGAGTLVLGGANTYAGSTIIDRGTLRFTTTQSMTVGTNGLTFGAAAGGTTVGTLDLATGVNATFGGTFLVQTNSASANTINIPVGQTLRFNNNFIVGYNSASASTTKLTATGGGTLTIGAAGQPTNLGVNIGNGASAASNAATVDLIGLGTFYANLGTGTFRIGSPTNSAGTATAGSTLILAPTSTIIATTITSDSPDSGVTQALKLGSGTNTLNATTIELGGSTSGRTNGTLDFNGITGTLVVRNLAGTGRVTNINVQNGATSTGANVSATVNLVGHNADILATTMTVGGRSAGTTGNGTGSFSFDTGTLDLTTLSVASRTGTTLTTGTVTGTVVLGGGTSTIGTLTMATNSSSASTTGDAVATVTISGGTNTISTLTMGVNTVAGAPAPCPAR